MARTKASVGAKISIGKSSKARCSVAPSTSGTNAGGSDKSRASYSGGNPVCPRDTPQWQKRITNFLITKGGATVEDDDASGTSSEVSKMEKKSKKNVIESDEEEKIETQEISQNESKDVMKNHVLDDSIILEPLDGENSHKIEEYYNKNSKGKGKGKKTTNKENFDANRNIPTKRELESDTPSESINKKVKLV